ncbi:glycosyltransferase family 4 protein [Streptomyces sp. SID10853]|uniref:glycosyltransferase n=1 Tax=Streptomyces sp. SID10853 TaxID=2706028 RepID=UPI0013BFB20B|nr:glycosyltransferase [Streptomyces sp. SID10853]NDZ83268.1 glycosyltransferase family 4 protein [Streptomyces sp. SID10853]
MRLHVHDYGPENTSGILDGAVLMHRTMSDLITARADAVPHDITRGAAALGTPAAGDVVYAGNGPYAHLYHLWREEHGGRYRIVREVHTTFWSGYWTQEELCAPLHRPGDTVLFPSEYTRQVFLRCFPGIPHEDAVVAYPMLDAMPRHAPRPAPTPGEVLRIGYLGALSKAKNFDQVLEAFARCHDDSGGRARLVYAGKANDPRWEAGAVLDGLAERGVPEGHVTSLGLIGADRLADFFSRVDVLLFPSTASRESLGRVVFEALAHGVPVLAAAMGPAMELLPASCLVPADLFTTPLTMDRVVALGRVDTGALTARLLARDWEPARMRDTEAFELPAFWRALTAGGGPRPAVTADHDTNTVARLGVSPRRGFDPAAASADAHHLFLDYFQHRDAPVLRRITELEENTGTPRPDLRALVAAPERNLADYRALPRLTDALVLPPLTYTIAAQPVPAPEVVPV